MIRTGLWLAVIGISAWSQSARAAGVPVVERLNLDYRGVCLVQAQLVQGVIEWLGSKTVADELSVQVVGGDHPTPNAGFSLYRDGRRIARRDFKQLPGGCADLQAVMPFAIALAIDARVAARVSDTKDRSLPTPAPTIETVTVSPSNAPAPADWHVALAARALFSTTPTPTPAMRFEVRHRWRRIFELAAGGIISAGSTAQIAGGDVATRFAAAHAAGCLRQDRPLGLDGCVGITAGSLWAAGAGFGENRTGHGLYVAPTLALGLTWSAATHWSVRAGVEVMTAVSRPSWAVRDRANDVVAHASVGSVGVAGGAGVRWHF